MKRIKNVQTGHIFVLEEEEAKRVLLSNLDLFVALDNDLNVLPEEPNGNVNVKDLVKGTVDFEAMNVQALRKFARENNIDLKGCGNDKDKIVARIKGE